MESMIKVLCDACNSERKHEEVYKKFTVACHLVEPSSKGFINRDGVQVSGRTVDYDVCPRCYNVVLGAAVAKFNELQKLGADLKAVQERL